MQYLKYPNLYILTTAPLLLISCKKKEFPSETQEGKGTFGCYINGEKFVPHKRLFSYGDAFRSTLNNLIENGYFSNVNARMESKCDSKYISIALDSIKLVEGKRYPILNSKRGNASAALILTRNCQIFEMSEAYTTDDTGGEILITKYDSVKRFASGTFWFNAITQDGQKIEVRDGRFDTLGGQ